MVWTLILTIEPIKPIKPIINLAIRAIWNFPRIHPFWQEKASLKNELFAENLDLRTRTPWILNTWDTSSWLRGHELYERLDGCLCLCLCLFNTWNTFSWPWLDFCCELQNILIGWWRRAAISYSKVEWSLGATKRRKSWEANFENPKHLFLICWCELHNRSIGWRRVGLGGTCQEDPYRDEEEEEDPSYRDGAGRPRHGREAVWHQLSVRKWVRWGVTKQLQQLQSRKFWEKSIKVIAASESGDICGSGQGSAFICVCQLALIGLPPQSVTS